MHEHVDAGVRAPARVADSSVGSTTPVHQVVRPAGGDDRLVHQLDRAHRRPLAARVHVEGDRVAAREHRDPWLTMNADGELIGVTERDHAPRQPVLDREAVLAGERARLEVLDAERRASRRTRSSDLVAHAAEARLLVRARARSSAWRTPTSRIASMRAGGAGRRRPLASARCAVARGGRRPRRRVAKSPLRPVAASGSRPAVAGGRRAAADRHAPGAAVEQLARRRGGRSARARSR